jgi:hypothetical protein
MFTLNYTGGLVLNPNYKSTKLSKLSKCYPLVVSRVGLHSQEIQNI